APLSRDVFISGRVGDVCRTDRRQNCNRYKPRVFHGTTLPLLENPQALYVKRNDGEADFVSRIHRKIDFGQTRPTFSCSIGGMHKYRLYLYDAEDHLIAPALVISADNDDAATEQAEKMLDGARAELRDGDRLVKRLPSKD